MQELKTVKRKVQARERKCLYQIKAEMEYSRREEVKYSPRKNKNETSGRSEVKKKTTEVDAIEEARRKEIEKRGNKTKV